MRFRSVLIQTVLLAILALFVSAPAQAAVAPASSGIESTQVSSGLGGIQDLVQAEKTYELVRVATYGQNHWHRPRHRYWHRPRWKRCFYYWKKKKKRDDDDDDDDDDDHAWHDDDDDDDDGWGGKSNKYKKHDKLKRRYGYGYGGRYKAHDRYKKYRRYVGYRGHKRFKRWKKWRRYYHGKPWWKKCPISK